MHACSSTRLGYAPSRPRSRSSSIWHLCFKTSQQRPSGSSKRLGGLSPLLGTHRSTEPAPTRYVSLSAKAVPAQGGSEEQRAGGDGHQQVHGRLLGDDESSEDENAETTQSSGDSQDEAGAGGQGAGGQAAGPAAAFAGPVPLSTQQLAAVQANHDVICIPACPGSGKSEVLVQRCVYQMFITGWLGPLGLTFNRAAAESLQGRLLTAMALSGKKPDEMVRTFDKYAGLLVKNHWHKLSTGPYQGLQPLFQKKKEKIENQEADMYLMLHVIKLFNNSSSPFVKRRFFHQLCLAKWLLHLIRYINNTAPHIPGSIQQVSHEYGRRLHSLIQQIGTKVPLEQPLSEGLLSILYYTFMIEKRNTRRLTFNDDMRYALDILSSCPDVLAEERARWQHIFVDENQCTSAAQYEIVHLLKHSGNNLCVAMDVHQGINSWRGADPDVMQRFKQDYPHALHLPLTENYRSTPCIVEASKTLLAEAYRDYMAGNSLSASQMSIAQHGQTLAMTAMRQNTVNAKVQHVSAADMAAFLAAHISSRVAGGGNYNDFLIQTRTNKEAMQMAEELRRRGIPVWLQVKLYTSREARHAISLLRWVLSPSFDCFLEAVCRALRGQGLQDFGIKTHWQPRPETKKQRMAALTSLAPGHETIEKLKSAYPAKIDGDRWTSLVCKDLTSVALTRAELDQVLQIYAASHRSGTYTGPASVLGTVRPIPSAQARLARVGPPPQLDSDELHSLDNVRALLVLLRSVCLHEGPKGILVWFETVGRYGEHVHSSETYQVVVSLAGQPTKWSTQTQPVRVVDPTGRVWWPTSATPSFSQDPAFQLLKAAAQFVVHLKAGEETDEKPQRPPQAVDMATMHRSKGLEYPEVFVLNLHQGRFPSFRHRPGSAPSDPMDEIRLMFTAMTRAMDWLWLVTDASKIESPFVTTLREAAARLPPAQQFLECSKADSTGQLHPVPLRPTPTASTSSAGPTPSGGGPAPPGAAPSAAGAPTSTPPQGPAPGGASASPTRSRSGRKKSSASTTTGTGAKTGNTASAQGGYVDELCDAMLGLYLDDSTDV